MEGPGHAADVQGRAVRGGTIIETGTDSYHLASTRACSEQPAKAG
ncbi:ATPase [Streptomyces sp. SID11385]|nr:ATPase [Streptomyces sp. SID11385]